MTRCELSLHADTELLKVYIRTVHVRFFQMSEKVAVSPDMLLIRLYSVLFLL